MKALIYTNPTRDTDGSITEKVRCILADKGVEFEMYRQGMDVPCEFDAIFTIGGDGTILHAASISGGRPILGINAGSVGFMTAFDAADCEEKLSEVLAGKYIVTEHMLVKVEVCRGGECVYGGTALNEVTAKSAYMARTAVFDVFSDGRHMARVQGDGIIAATPTGSTAYSMSAGGPLVDPALSAIILTPVCAHNVIASSFVLSSESKAEIDCESSAKLSIDGVYACDLETGDKITIYKSDAVCRLVRLQNYSFYDIINKKLFDGR